MRERTPLVEIQPQHIALADLLTRRLFRIPQYQRSYSWGEKHRTDLFNDIKKSYLSENSQHHFMATIVALRRGTVAILADEYQRVDIVDGQQRITTLVLLLKAIAKALDRSDDDQDAIRSKIDTILVKQDKASHLLLQTNHDGSDYFANYITTGAYPDSTEAKTLADRRLLVAMEECEAFVALWTQEQRAKIDTNPLISLFSHINNRLTFIFHEIGDERLVYTVFEVLNSRGLEVSWFDRLKSMLMAVVFEADSGNQGEIIDQVHQLWADIYGVVGLHLGMSTESLRFAATLRSVETTSRPLGQEAAVNLLLKCVKRDPSRVIQITKWLKSVTVAVDRLQENPRLNAVTRISHARLVATAVNLRSDLSEDERERAMRRWESVTFRIFGMHRKDARTAVGHYTRLARRIVKDNLPIDDILGELAKIGKAYSARDGVKELRESDCYTEWKEELRYFFQRYEEYLAKEAGQNFDNSHWNHIWKVSVDESIEHISPQSSGKSFVHRLGNLLLLPPKLNSKLGARSPKKKASAYNKTGLLIAQDVSKRLSRRGGWTKGMVDERENKLLGWAVQEWSD